MNSIFFNNTSLVLFVFLLLDSRSSHFKHVTVDSEAAHLTQIKSMVDCLCNPDFAGPDKFICPSTVGGVSIGCPSVGSDPGCSGICFEWSPAHGLNAGDLTKSFPTVTPTTTTTYTVKVIKGLDVLGSFEVTVYVIEPELVIYKPKVIAGNTTTMANQALGAQTFENLDNDDQDHLFDNLGSEKHVGGGDDELVKLEIKLSPVTLAEKKVKLRAVQGAGDINVWYHESKGIKYHLGDDINLVPDPTNTYLTAIVWVEGMNAQPMQRGVEFNLVYLGEIISCNEAKAFLTILGVERLTWYGIGNSVNDDENLDADPNVALAVGWPNAVRVFPDARLELPIPAPGLPKREVKLKIELTTVPIEPVNMYLKSYDIDDPLNDIAVDFGNDPSPWGFIDPNDVDMAKSGFYEGTSGTLFYTSQEDNRTSVNKNGKLVGEDLNEIATLLFTSGSAEIKLQELSMHPGDNYRVVINGDYDYFVNLENRDNPDKYKIVDRFIKWGSGVLMTSYLSEIQKPLNYASAILTVWRFLHLEDDSMEDVNNSNKLSDYIFLDFGHLRCPT